jgi:hypothetical protein
MFSILFYSIIDVDLYTGTGGRRTVRSSTGRSTTTGSASSRGGALSSSHNPRGRILVRKCGFFVVICL